MTSRLAAVTLLTSLTLAGCGGSDSDSDTSKPKDTATSTATSAAPSEDAPAAEAADGVTVKGDGYTYTVPKGWDKPKQPIPGTEVADTFVADLTDTDGFADNINVIKQNTKPPKPLKEFKDELGEQLTTAGGTNVEVKEDGTIDGEDSIHISSTQGTQNLTEQYFVVHDDSTYFITLSHSNDVSEADRAKIAASILTTWKWTS